MFSEFDALKEQTDEEYAQALLQDFRAAHSNGVGRLGVPFPASRQIGPMLSLFEKMGKPVSQSEITAFCRRYGFPEYNKQLRHIAVQGYYLRTGNRRSTNMEKDPEASRDSLVLVSLKKKNPLTTANRSSQIPFMEWDEILEMYKDRGCAMCGMKHDHYDRGHLDRTKPAIRGNVVPLCSPCNNWLQAKDCDAEINDQLVCRPVVSKRR